MNRSLSPSDIIRIGVKDREQVLHESSISFSGSCALVAMVSDDDHVLTVANAGDCRAVIAKQNSSGKLIAEALTQDHSPSNRAEFERLNREHPNEQQTVCFAPNSKSPLRVLGGMMPSRFISTHHSCFGDGRYKWSLKDQEKVDALVSGIPLKSYSWVRPDHLFTPPYLTATPDIITRKISSKDAFLILGTDGLYDTLDNQHCVDIVADWIEKKSSNQVDSNAATYLIRKAVQCGKDTAFLSRMLTLHPSISRQFRDDITVSIMFFNGFENY